MTHTNTTPLSPVDDAAWLQPVSAAEPCGPNLEYEQDYAVLFARFAPQTDAQYGSFVDRPEPPDWAEVERDCRRLLLRSKDISILVWLARCRTRLAAAVGLRDVLRMLVQLLQRYPDDVHPQRRIEGEDDPAVRANALAALTDPQGLLSDVRDVVLSPTTAYRLTVKDVERAHAIPRAVDALPIESVIQQLDDLRAQGHLQLQALAECGALLQDIAQWSQQHLQEDAPALTVWTKLLAPYSGDALAAPRTPPPPVDAVQAALAPSLGPALLPEPAAPPLARHAADHTAPAAGQREQVRAHIRTAREWLDLHEPSSPVAVLLKQAERLLGRRFSEVAQAIPPDLLAQWDQ